MQYSSRTSSVTANVLNDYKELIENAVIDLEAHLKLIDEKLEAIVLKDTESLSSDLEELQPVEEERLSSKTCLKLIARLSSLIEQTQTKKRHNLVNSGVSQLGGMMTDETFQELIRDSGLGQLREAETLSPNLQLEHLNQFTNKEISGDSAKNDRKSRRC